MTAALKAPPLSGAGFAVVLATSTLSLYHLNPRLGDIGAIAESLAANAQYRPIVVNAGTTTGRPLEVLAGNHTLLAARRLGWATIQCWQIDVDDVEAARIVAADNRTADLGSYDEAALVALLQPLAESDAGLVGTGYTEEQLGKMLAGPAEGSADAYGGTEDADIRNQFGVIVMCADENEQAKVYDDLSGAGYTLRVVTV